MWWPGLPLGGVCVGAGESHLAEVWACLAPSLTSPSGAELPGTDGLVRTLPHWHALPLRCPAFLLLENSTPTCRDPGS